MTCPWCDKESPPSADRCDCGYRFGVDRAEEKPRSSNAMPWIQVASFVFLTWTGFYFCSGSKDRPAKQYTSTGDIVALSKPTVCAPSRRVLDEVSKLVWAKEQDEATAVLIRSNGTILPVGERVKLIERELGVARVKALSADRFYWVS